MSTLLRKGFPYSRTYSSTDWPTLTADWTGSMSMYKTYPGTSYLTVPLVLLGNTLRLTMLTTDINNLDTGVYYFVTTFSNAVLGVTLDMLEYATVADVVLGTVPMTKLYITIGKVDNTPAGKAIKTAINSNNGLEIVQGWQGLPLTVTHPVATRLSGSVIDNETTTATTNQAGYAEMYVIKGQTVTVSCPGFDTPVTVNTTGLDSVDLSTLFPV